MYMYMYMYACRVYRVKNDDDSPVFRVYAVVIITSYVRSVYRGVYGCIGCVGV